MPEATVFLLLPEEVPALVVAVAVERAVWAASAHRLGLFT
jgi:hypothetical protein